MKLEVWKIVFHNVTKVSFGGLISGAVGAADQGLKAGRGAPQAGHPAPLHPGPHSIGRPVPCGDGETKAGPTPCSSAQAVFLLSTPFLCTGVEGRGEQ